MTIGNLFDGEGAYKAVRAPMKIRGSQKFKGEVMFCPFAGLWMPLEARFLGRDGVLSA